MLSCSLQLSLCRGLVCFCETVVLRAEPVGMPKPSILALVPHRNYLNRGAPYAGAWPGEQTSREHGRWRGRSAGFEDKHSQDISNPSLSTDESNPRTKVRSIFRPQKILGAKADIMLWSSWGDHALAIFRRPTSWWSCSSPGGDISVVPHGEIAAVLQPMLRQMEMKRLQRIGSCLWGGGGVSCVWLVYRAATPGA